MEKTRVYHQPEHLAFLEDMRAQGILCDVTIQVEDAKFPAHKIILAAATRYFANMFLNNFQETNSKIILINGVNASNMNALITFAYTGQITLTEKNILGLIKDADYLDFLGLKEGGIQFLKSCLNIGNIYEVYCFAKTLNCTSLLEDCILFIKQHFRDIWLADSYLDFDIELLNDLLSSQELHVSSHLIFKAIMRWISNDLDERKYLLLKLLKFVNISFMRNEFLTDYFFKGGLESIEHKHSNLVADVMSFYKSCQQDNYTNEKYIIAIDSCDSDIIEIYNPALDAWKTITASNGYEDISNAIVHRDKLYAIGGSRIQVYEPQNKIWKIRSKMNFPRRATDIASIHEFLYVCGGYYTDADEDREYSDVVERYCPKSDQWQTMSPLNIKRYNHGIVAFQGYIYAIGGFDGSDFFDSVERYDPRTDQWTTLESTLKMGRSGPGTAALNGKIYACGGMPAEGDEEVSKTVEVYDPETDSWEYVSDMNTERRGLRLIAYKDKLWAIGGFDESDNGLETVEVYDPDSNSWSYAPSMSKIEGEVSCAVVSKWW